MGSRQQEKVVLRQKISVSTWIFRKFGSTSFSDFLFLLPDPKNTFGNPTKSRMDYQTFKKPLSLSLSFCTLQPLPVRFRLMLNSEKKIKHHLNEISNSKNY